MNNQYDEMEYVYDMLKDAEKQGLLVEIVTYAIRHAQQNPYADVTACIDVAYNDWVK